MSQMLYHSIVVTSRDQILLEKTYERANKLFGILVTPIMLSIVNRCFTYFIAPDGSKEGWDTSYEYDVLRKDFIDYLKSFTYDDGSTSIKYCEFCYGGDSDGFETRIINHSGE